MYPGLDSNQAAYYGMITIMDEYIGKIISALKAKNMYDNTLLIFTTDVSWYNCMLNTISHLTFKCSLDISKYKCNTLLIYDSFKHEPLPAMKNNVN